ncbi:MAG TPA: 23S rRNA (uracil(1939)-C(5))-methyltransferase RlmD [Acidobacteriaceae bacterium]|nr:23S rRNA (uracil(1939)-C(5))-methyltransferase RlmD [Acidobacteriaceae bacterium]
MKPVQLGIERVVYGGFGLARSASATSSSGPEALFVPFTLPGELVEAVPFGIKGELRLIDVLEPSSERVQPGCPHFGVCGGCHLQMANYPEQLRLKQEVLRESLMRAGVSEFPEITMHSADAWHYRNRIRLHVTREGDAFRLGYRERASNSILPISTCPIAAPLLWRAAEAMLEAASEDAEMQRWLESAAEVELFCAADESRVQITLLSKTPKQLSAASFEKAFAVLQQKLPELAGAGALQIQPRTAQVQRELANWGAAGLNYEIAGERYWIARGGFFQVNRFLLPAMVDLVCSGQRGQVAWDLFAGVGLFARILAHTFEQVTGVEANPSASRELGASLQRIGPQHKGVAAVIVDFLRSAVLQRDRPDLVVLDPPRAGAGMEVCQLLSRLAPPQMVYVSCDPVTLGRDLAVLQTVYTIEALHSVDLFPQTYHQEAVVRLRRRS